MNKVCACTSSGLIHLDSATADAGLRPSTSCEIKVLIHSSTGVNVSITLGGQSLQTFPHCL